MAEYKAGDRISLDEYGYLHLTEETAEKLNNGESISINPFTDEVKEHSVEDLGVTSDSWVNANEAPVVHRKTDGPRVHVDKAQEATKKYMQDRYGADSAIHINGDYQTTTERMVKAIKDEQAKDRYGTRSVHNRGEAIMEPDWAKPTHAESLGYYQYAPRATDLNYGPDMINHPPHYAEGRKHEPKDVIRDWGLNYNLGSAVKYISRAGRKENMIQDIDKAIAYLGFEREALTAEGEEDE